MDFLVDSDIIIDFLNNQDSAVDFFKKENKKEFCISIISWIEIVYGFKKTKINNKKRLFEEFLKKFQIIIVPIDKKIAELIDNNQVLQQKKQVLTEFKGVGEQTSHALLLMCPELGNLTRRQIASLAGVAPHPRESGHYQGYRSTKGGRSQVKRALFMAVLSAKKYNPLLKKFYDGLVARGKKKMVALTATMRKMIVILNAKVRDFFQSNNNHPTNAIP